MQANSQFKVMSKHIETCLKDHNRILQEGFQKIARILEELVKQITMTFLNNGWTRRVDETNMETEDGEQDSADEAQDYNFVDDCTFEDEGYYK